MAGKKWTEEQKVHFKLVRTGIKFSEERKQKLRDAYNPTKFKKGQVSPNKGKKMSEETKLKISIAKKGKNMGRDNHNWIVDRSLVKVGDRCLHDPLTKKWRQEVKIRDGFTCRIADNNCGGRLEVHHILSWRDYPELRYQPNNGITLCHAHHPRKRAEEKRLIPTFQELVSVSKKIISQ